MYHVVKPIDQITRALDGNLTGYQINIVEWYVGFMPHRGCGPWGNAVKLNRLNPQETGFW